MKLSHASHDDFPITVILPKQCCRWNEVTPHWSSMLMKSPVISRRTKRAVQLYFFWPHFSVQVRGNNPTAFSILQRSAVTFVLKVGHKVPTHTSRWAAKRQPPYAHSAVRIKETLGADFFLTFFLLWTHLKINITAVTSCESSITSNNCLTLVPKSKHPALSEVFLLASWRQKKPNNALVNSCRNGIAEGDLRKTSSKQRSCISKTKTWQTAPSWGSVSALYNNVDNGSFKPTPHCLWITVWIIHNTMTDGCSKHAFTAITTHTSQAAANQQIQHLLVVVFVMHKHVSVIRPG